MTLEACLPDHLRGPTTSITKIAGGLSGAGVYRVEATDHVYVLKVASEGEPIEAWRQSLEIQRRAGDAGVAPRVIHHDEARRAVVSEHVVNRGFAPRLFNPETRDDAIRQLGETIRRVHALPLPADAVWRDPRDMIAPMRAQLATFALPSFVRTTIDEVLEQTPPPRERPLVTSHNDANPSNLVFDGERLLLLDWDMAGPNDPFYDLAAVALFLRMDDPTASALIAAYDAAPPAALPEGFVYTRRLVAALCATIFLHLARQAGHAGGDIPADRAPTLRDVYGLMASSALAPNTADGAWAFALALVRTISTT
ncbi:MAG: phosphotransferase family protein [Polyangiaceae bacterium]|nr:phosphotransferase family protein [Polyangiaceae bacterium]